YYISVPDQSSYSISGLSKTMPYSILPNTDDSLDISISSFTPNSLLTAFVDENKSPIASVSAILKDGNVPIATISSGLENDPDFGQAFFSDLAQKTYVLEATLGEFIDFSGIVNISGQVYDLIPRTKEEL